MRGCGSRRQDTICRDNGDVGTPPLREPSSRQETALVRRRRRRLAGPGARRRANAGPRRPRTVARSSSPRAGGRSIGSARKDVELLAGVGVGARRRLNAWRGYPWRGDRDGAARRGGPLAARQAIASTRRRRARRKSAARWRSRHDRGTIATEERGTTAAPRAARRLRTAPRRLEEATLVEDRDRVAREQADLQQGPERHGRVWRRSSAKGGARRGGACAVHEPNQRSLVWCRAR